MSIVVKEVHNKKEFKQFIDLPYRIYKNHPYYVPPLRFDEAATLRRDKNPAFDYCEARYWIAYKNEKPAGRIVAILNRAYNEKVKSKFLRFGWFDTIEDDAIAKALMHEVEAWAKTLNMQAVHGPLGFTDLDHEGLLVEGFDRVATMASLYNHRYYQHLLEKQGYYKDVDWIEHRVMVPNQMNERLEKLANAVKQRYELEVIDLKKTKDVLPYADAIFQLINDAYEDLYGVVPLTQKQMQYYTKQYFSFIRPDFLSLVANKQGELVALGITMPSLAKALQKANGKLFPFGFVHLLKALKRNDTADLLIVAVRKEYQNKGVNAVLMHETLKTYIKHGIRYVETNYQLEHNKNVQAMWTLFEHVQHKRRRCYIKYLNGHSE
jgi:GNAT superfamily N-acetyltransferase